LNTNFPYCQTASLLLAKANFQKGDMFANQKIKKAALYSASRERLKELIDQNFFFQKRISHTLNKADIDNSQIEINVIKKDSDSVGISVAEEKPVSQKEKELQALRDDITEVLKNLKNIETELKIREPNVSKENPLKSFYSESAESLKEEKKEENIIEKETKKVYIHDRNFGKTVKLTTESPLEIYLKNRAKSETEIVPLEVQQEIIQNFLKSKPTINRFSNTTDTQPNKDLSKTSTIGTEDLVSETLANILLKQGKIKKAIEAFEKLKLKYPEKSTYFAARIQQIKDSE
jgi:tetratricopeptide (TPR) repeat protein